MAVINNYSDFDIAQTFDCGQCFRFNKTGETEYSGVAFGKYIKIRQTDGEVICEGVSDEEFENIWYNFFDLNTDYGNIKKQIATDDIIKGAIECGSGIRILNQDLWECLISFIISQNNNIPRIKKIIESLCTSYGKSIPTDDGIKYAFPTPEELSHATKDELKRLGLGYRDEYVLNAVRSVNDSSFDLNELSLLATPKAREMLLSLKGIGGKVADCILLFGMHRLEVCPHDVWVKRIFTEKYNIQNITEKKGYELATSKWGNYAGVAQQYLFYAERENRK